MPRKETRRDLLLRISNSGYKDPSCKDKGWVHMRYTEDDERPHVERCDDCATFATDDDAREAHDTECDCAAWDVQLREGERP